MPPAYRNFLLDKGYDADAAITKFRAVKKGTGAESVTPCTVLGEAGRGIAQVGVTTAELALGKGVSVAEGGISEWEAGAALAADILVTTAADGRCVAAATGQTVWGRTRIATTAAGQRTSVTLLAVPHVHP